ncbi:hypothetical protein vseg_013802 [Gypsophila vaccaria]
MAGINGIERLHRDEMREIMIRVAAQPNGAMDFTRACAVSKSFRVFTEDSDVLREVSLTDFFPGSEGRYELLAEAGGLVARCARAGNLDAQLLFAKVVIVSAATLCNAKMEAHHSDVSSKFSALFTGSCNLINLGKSVRLLNHFSAPNTDRKELLDLVRNFLSQAKVRDLVEVQHHLKGFIALYLGPGKQHQYIIFLETLGSLCEKHSLLYGTTLDPHTLLLMIFKDLCKAGETMMRAVGVDEELYRPLQNCLVHMNEDVGYETLMKQLVTVASILMLGGQAAMTKGDYEVLVVKNNVLRIATVLKEYLKRLIDHEAFVLSARESLLSGFSALFDI